MTDRTRKSIGAIGLTLGLIALMILCTLTALHAVGTDDRLYRSEQTAAGVLPLSGLTEDGLCRVDAALAAYLAGDESALQAGGDTECALGVEIFGAEMPAFNAREMAHMRDCFRLFALLRKVRSRLIPWAILLIVGGAYLLEDRRRIRLCAWLSPVLLLLPLGVFAAWVASDFDAAFTFFHRMLFTNDLWLLDPRTDLLIRICPESMFLHMGVRIGVCSLIAMLAIPAVAALLSFIWPKRKGDDTWNNRDMRRASAQKRITFGRAGMR